MQLTPSYVVTIDSMIRALITSNWQRVAKEAAQVRRIMKVRPSTTRRELLTWLLDTVGIYPEGQGGNIRFDDMAAIEYEIDNLNVGSGLRLTTNEIEDNQLKDYPQVGAMDFAQKWARDRGAEGAYYARNLLFQLIKNGGTALAYDGQPYFSASHPVNPVGPSQGTYSNIITGVPINITPTGTAPQSTYMDALIIQSRNFASALATIASLNFGSFGGTIPRMLKPKIVVAPAALAFTVNQLVGGGGFLTSGMPAEFIAQTDNILRNYAFEEPIIAPELDAISTSNYYIGCEDVLSDEVGAFIFSERKPFELRGYPDTASAQTNRADMWEWTFKGRNVGAYGHPYLFFKCTP